MLNAIILLFYTSCDRTNITRINVIADYSGLSDKRNEKRDENGNKESGDSRDCWPMNSNDSAWLDPLHLPRAPILQHNVSLCHGGTTPLLSPSVMPAASPAAWSRVYGILDFGNPNGTAECRSRARAPVLHRGGNALRGGFGRERWFFNMHSPPPAPPPSFPGVAAVVPRYFSTPFSESNERIRDAATSDESWKYCRFCYARGTLSELRNGTPGNNDPRVIMFYRWHTEESRWELLPADLQQWSVLNLNLLDLTIFKGNWSGIE